MAIAATSQRADGASAEKRTRVEMNEPVTTGAADDMQVATNLARQMVTRWGMSERFGAVALAPRDAGYLGHADPFNAAMKPFSEATAQLIDAEVQQIVDDCYMSALLLVGRHRTELDALAQALLERESLDEAEILSVTGLSRAPRTDHTLDLDLVKA